MIKINFIGPKNSAKSLSCFLIAKHLSKQKKVIILNFDYFSKYKDIDNKFVDKNKVIKIDNNFELFNVKLNSKNDEDVLNEVNNIFKKFKNYEIVLIDHPISFSKLNKQLINNSSLIICNYKIQNDVLDYFKKLTSFLNDSNLTFKKMKILMTLSNNQEINLTKMLDYRKLFPGMMFDKPITYYEFNKYKELVDNQKLNEEYKQISENILENILL